MRVSPLFTLVMSLEFINSMRTIRSLFPRNCYRKFSLSMSKATNQVCIVGGGFGGLYTALKAESHGNLDITIIDGKDKFVFLPLLYELAVGTANVLEVAPSYKAILGKTKIKFVQGFVENINLIDMTVTTRTTNANITIKYDQLVLSVGACPRLDMIPGAVQNSLPFYSIEDAYKLKKFLRAFKSNLDKPILRVAVIGGGYSGVEVATSIAQNLGKDRVIVYLIDRNDRVMHNSPEHNRMVAERSLESFGVSINCNTAVEEVFPNSVRLRGPDGIPFDLPCDLTICTAGVQQSALVSALPLSKDSSGRLLTDTTLMCTGTSNVFALGDCASVEGVLLPSTAQVAMQKADVVANNLNIVANRSSTTRLEKFRYIPLGEMLTLGGDFADAAITGVGGLVRLKGPLAALARRVVYAARMPTPDQTVNSLVGTGIGAIGNFVTKVVDRVAPRVDK